MTYWFPLGFRVLVAVAKYDAFFFSYVRLEITLIGFEARDGERRLGRDGARALERADEREQLVRPDVLGHD